MRDKTELNIAINFAKEEFAFLTQCGFVCTEGYAPATYDGDKKTYVLKYTSSDKLVELAISLESYIVSCFIRRKIDNEFANYNDETNCLLVSFLDYLKTDKTEDQLKFYSYNDKMREKVIHNYAKLLTEYKDIVCGDEWFDTDTITHNRFKDYSLSMRKEIVPNNKPTIADLLTEKTKFLLYEGYNLLEDSNLLPPYQRQVWHIIYGNGINIIKIHQQDWRDFYYLFEITINNKTIFTANIQDYGNLEIMADHFVYELKEYL